MKEYEVQYYEVEEVLRDGELRAYSSDIKVDNFIAKNEEQALLHINHNYISTKRHIIDIKSKTITGKTLTKFKTCDIVEELSRRSAVQDIVVKPHLPIKIKIDGKAVQCDIKSGPCHILVVYD